MWNMWNMGNMGNMDNSGTPGLGCSIEAIAFREFSRSVDVFWPVLPTTQNLLTGSYFFLRRHTSLELRMVLVATPYQTPYQTNAK